MPVAGGGFEQCYNAQAAVAEGSLLVVCHRVFKPRTTSSSFEPMLGKDRTPCRRELGEAETLLADTGYFSAGNVAAPCEKAAGDRSADRHGPTSRIITSGRALRRSPPARKTQRGRGHGASA